MTTVPTSSPSTAATGLGYLAVVPFVAGAVLCWWVAPASRLQVGQALSAYAAVVVSFIGAIHWGVGFSQPAPAPKLFVWGIVPSLVAWAAVLMPPQAGLAVDAAALIVCYLVDRAWYPGEGIARWLPLRLRLTAFAAPACLAASVGLWVGLRVGL